MLLSVKNAAKTMGVSVALVYALCAGRQLRHSRVGLGRGKIVISEEAVAEFLLTRESGPAPRQPGPPPRKLRLNHLEVS